MNSITNRINEYLKRTLAHEIAKENNPEKMTAFINTLNDLIVNYSKINNIYCFEFVKKNDELYIIRCPQFFCPEKKGCKEYSCKLSEFTNLNDKIADNLFDKMKEKINSIRPNYLSTHSVKDYIDQFLSSDDEYFDVIIINNNVILTEEDEKRNNTELNKVLNEYLVQNLKMSFQKNMSNNSSNIFNDFINIFTEKNMEIVKYFWQIFNETQNLLNDQTYKKTIGKLSENNNNITKSNDSTKQKDHDITIFCNKYELTEREKEVLLKVFEGKSTKEIGDILFISPGTVKIHIQRIFNKTYTHSRIELFSLFNKFNTENPRN